MFMLYWSWNERDGLLVTETVAGPGIDEDVGLLGLACRYALTSSLALWMIWSSISMQPNRGESGGRQSDGKSGPKMGIKAPAMG